MSAASQNATRPAWGRAFAERPLLAWSAVAGLALLAWLLAADPLMDHLESLERETTALRQAQPARQAALAREQARLQAAREQARQALAQGEGLTVPDPLRLQGELTRLAQAKGLTLTALTPLPSPGEGEYARPAWSLQAQGDFKAVAAFLEALASTPDLLHPLSFSLARAPGSALLMLEMRVAALARN